MDRIENELGFNREMLVVLGLLLGCDYEPKGVPGVGKELACKFLEELAEFNKSNEKQKFSILDLVRTWSSTERPYVDNKLKYENRIRKAVLQNCATDSFPNEQIISEYLSYSKLARALMSDERYLKIRWERPLMSELQLFNETKQAWPFEYTASKVVPLLLRYEDVMQVALHKRDVQPARINAIRRRSGKELYEVVWAKMKSVIDRDLSPLTEYATLESKEWFEGVYPDVARAFKDTVESKKRSKSNRLIDVC
jgi:flap endonuclease GEN